MTTNIPPNFRMPEDQLLVMYSSSSSGASSYLENPMENVFIVSMMILAWFLLIVGFSICFCNQCGRTDCLLFKLSSCCGLEGVRSEQGDFDADSITTVGTVRDRTNNAEPVEVCRNCPPNYEVESLPSYTIVSGLPTYDDAIEEFRKAGIILTPPIPIIKIFESKDSKDILNIESGNNEGDNVSLNSTNNCTCGANSNNTTITSNNNNLLLTPTTNNTQFIELSPEQLSQLSQKRLSLQIAFPQVPQISGQFRRHSRPRIDMRNNLLRSRIGNVPAYEGLPEIHRSSSTFSLANEQRNINMALHMQHRGSLF
ncbi:comm3 isoform X2 [Musca autumnalis]|uniref:comm3 isoform X2 n=2 Tax=Musca autumnalis TaxID=221902 RepID=UPI003CF52326